MTNLARKPPKSAHVVSPASEMPVHVDLANERHYSVIEISELWGLSEETVRKLRKAG